MQQDTDTFSHTVVGESASVIPPTTFQFEDPGNATTCSSFSFSWTFTGDHVTPMTLLVVDEQHPTLLTQTPLRTLALGVPSNSQMFTWATVDIEEGWYRVKAIETVPMIGLPVHTATFFVKNSSDVSCLQPTSASVLFFHKSMNGPSQPSSHHVPPRHIGVGELIGIILGGLAGVVLLAVAFLFPRLWRRALPSPKKRRRYILY